MNHRWPLFHITALPLLALFGSRLLIQTSHKMCNVFSSPFEKQNLHSILCQYLTLKLQLGGMNRTVCMLIIWMWCMPAERKAWHTLFVGPLRYIKFLISGAHRWMLPPPLLVGWFSSLCMLAVEPGRRLGDYCRLLLWKWPTFVSPIVQGRWVILT